MCRRDAGRRLWVRSKLARRLWPPSVVRTPVPFSADSSASHALLHSRPDRTLSSWPIMSVMPKRSDFSQPLSPSKRLSNIDTTPHQQVNWFYPEQISARTAMSRRRDLAIREQIRVAPACENCRQFLRRDAAGFRPACQYSRISTHAGFVFASLSSPFEAVVVGLKRERNLLSAKAARLEPSKSLPWPV